MWSPAYSDSIDHRARKQLRRSSPRRSSAPFCWVIFEWATNLAVFVLRDRAQHSCAAPRCSLKIHMQLGNIVKRNEQCEQKKMCASLFNVVVSLCRTLIKYHKRVTWCTRPRCLLRQSTTSRSPDHLLLRSPLCRQLDNVLAFTFINQSHLLRQTHSARTIDYCRAVAQLTITH